MYAHGGKSGFFVDVLSGNVAEDFNIFPTRYDPVGNALNDWQGWRRYKKDINCRDKRDC